MVLITLSQVGFAKLARRLGSVVFDTPLSRLWLSSDSSPYTLHGHLARKQQHPPLDRGTPVTPLSGGVREASMADQERGVRHAALSP